MMSIGGEDVFAAAADHGATHSGEPKKILIWSTVPSSVSGISKDLLPISFTVWVSSTVIKPG